MMFEPEFERRHATDLKHSEFDAAILSGEGIIVSGR